MTTALLLGSLVAGGGLAALVWRRHRSAAFAVVAAAVLVHYHLDGVATVARGSLYFSRTYPDLPLVPGAAFHVALAATAVLALWCLGYLALRARGPARPVALPAGRVRMSAAAALLLPLAVAVQRLGGVTDLLLLNRQQVLTGDLLGMIVFHAVPAAAALACYGMATERGARRLGWGALFVVYLGVALVSGSRSAFLLNVLAPAGAFLVARAARRLPRAATWPASAKLATAVVAVALLATGAVASTVYREATRGAQEAEGPFASPDLTQFDAAAHLVAADLGPAPTYAAAAVVAVPRGAWPDKPLSGNAALSQALFAERYETSRAEVTAGLVGEAWLNARWLGPLVAAALLLVLVAAAERLLVTPGVATMLGCVVLFRGLNLVRSDLLNTVVPLAFAAVLFWVAARPAARVEPVRRLRAAEMGGAG